MSGSSRGTTIIMVEGALCIALSVTLSKLNLFALPQGGSVDLELVPLLLFAWRRGMKWAFGVGSLTGIVKVLLGSHFYNVFQVLLDYPLAYACTALAASFMWLAKHYSGEIWGLIIAGIAQTGCHVASGAIFFAEYAPAGQSPWTYSLMYNAPVMTIKYALSGVIAWLLWRALEKALPTAKLAKK